MNAGAGADDTSRDYLFANEQEYEKVQPQVVSQGAGMYALSYHISRHKRIFE